MHAGAHARGSRELQQRPHVHTLGADRLAVAAEVAGVDLPGDGAEEKRVDAHVGVDLHGDLLGVLAEALQHLAGGDAVVAVALQAARGLGLGLFLGVALGARGRDRRHRDGAVVLEVAAAAVLVETAVGAGGLAGLQEDLDGLGDLHTLGDGLHESGAGELPPMNTLGSEVVSSSRSQLSSRPKESPPAPVAT